MANTPPPFPDTFPPEILGEILHQSVRLGGKRYFAQGLLDYEGRNDLLNLCRVSKAWRSAALLTNSLWSGIVINTEDYNEDSLISAHKVVSWLHRAGAVPRTLDFYISTCYRCCEGEVGSDSEDEERSPYRNLCVMKRPEMAAILKNGGPFQKIGVECWSPGCWWNLGEALAPVGQPRSSAMWDPIALNCLSISLLHWEEASYKEDTSIFNGLPSVKSFELRLPEGPPPILPVAGVEGRKLLVNPAFLQNLTTFTFSCSWALAQFVEVLQHCTNVAVLTLDTRCENIRYTPSPALANLMKTGVLLPNVHTLRFTQVDSYALSIIPFLRMPLLRTFDFDSSHLADVLRADALPSIFPKWWMEQHFANLETLRLSTIKWEFRALKAIISFPFPSLKHLVLNNFAGTDVLFDWFEDDLPQAGEEWFPNLETLELTDVKKNFSFESVWKYLKTRLGYREWRRKTQEQEEREAAESAAENAGEEDEDTGDEDEGYSDGEDQASSDSEGGSSLTYEEDGVTIVMDNLPCSIKTINITEILPETQELWSVAPNANIYPSQRAASALKRAGIRVNVEVYQEADNSF